MAYADKVPGKWALLVDTTQATTAVDMAGLRCSQSDYPLDLSQAFQSVALQTFKSVADDVRLSDHVLSQSEFAAGGYAGVITLRVVGLRAKGRVSGAVDAQADVHTEIDATILVTEDGRRLVDASETGSGDAAHNAGIVCGGAADAVADASNAAMQETARKLAEQFANARSIRYAEPGPGPTPMP